MDNTFDSLYYTEGKLLAGIDESGVSDIAGPLVAACVILPKTYDDTRIFEVNDCKRIPERHRKEYAKIIWETAIAIGIGETHPIEIDFLGKRKSIILAMIRAVNACQTTYRKGILPDKLLIDGELLLPTNIEQHCIKDGDLKSLSIASASIVAKVHRDTVMLEHHSRAPHYGWNKNKGAPCENQYRGMDIHGIQIGVHRTRSFPFVPDRKKENERYWDWRRGLWRTKTTESLLLELGENSWININEINSQKPSEDISSQQSKTLKNNVERQEQ